MKKSIYGLLIIIALFMLTGCGSSVDKKNFFDLKYEEPIGYSKKDELEIGIEDMTLIFNYDEDENKSINLYYLKGKDYSYVEDEYTYHAEKEINGTTWRIINDEDFGVEYSLYYIVHDGAVYQIELNGIDKYQEEFEKFINTLSFK